jgi:hypothetical protein
MRDVSGRDYESAFENWLIENRIQYVKADEHKRPGLPGTSVKNFDFLLYPHPGRRVIAEVKGRTFRGTALARRTGLECWVTRDDIASLQTWRAALGPDHEAIFVFAYRVVNVDVDCDGCDRLRYGSGRYVFLCLRLDDYCEHMKQRSVRWGTMTLPAASFRAHALSLSAFLKETP